MISAPSLPLKLPFAVSDGGAYGDLLRAGAVHRVHVDARIYFSALAADRRAHRMPFADGVVIQPYGILRLRYELMIFIIQ